MVTRPILTIFVLPSGDLRVAATAPAIHWLLEERARDRTDSDILWDGAEGYWDNGHFHPFDAGDGNPFVGLSSAPCIAEDMGFDDDGQRHIIGRFWAYLDYQVRSFVDEILEHGYVDFALVD